MLWTVVSFIGFTMAVAVISYIKTKGDDQTTAEGYFLAGRGLPGIVIAGSLLLTNISAEQLVGTNGQTFGWNGPPPDPPFGDIPSVGDGGECCSGNGAPTVK